MRGMPGNGPSEMNFGNGYPSQRENTHTEEEPRSSYLGARETYKHDLVKTPSSGPSYKNDEATERASPLKSPRAFNDFSAGKSPGGKSANFGERKRSIGNQNPVLPQSLLKASKFKN